MQSYYAGAAEQGGGGGGGGILPQSTVRALWIFNQTKFQLNLPPTCNLQRVVKVAGK